MNVASLELCQELYELSGWEDTEYIYGSVSSSGINAGVVHTDWKEYQDYSWPAYDLGYLLRKLPDYMLTSFVYADDENGKFGWTLSWQWKDEKWEKHGGSILFADTPEDAVACLAIKLFKQDILPRQAVADV